MTTSSSGSTVTGSAGGGDWPDLSGQEVHLLIDENAQPFRDLFNKMASDFTKATGAQVNNEFAGIGSSLPQRLAQLIQAGQPPDVVFQSGAETTNLANQSVLAPVNEAIEYWEEQWGETPQDLRIQIDGNDWLMPISSKGAVMWYRDDIFEEKPTDWGTFIDIVSRTDGQDNLAGHVLPLDSSSGCAIWYQMSQMYANNVTLAERRNGEIQIGWDRGSNGKRAVEVLEHMQELHKYSHTGGDVGCEAMTQAMAANIAQSSTFTVTRPKNQAVIQHHPHAGDIRGVVPPSPDGNPHTIGNSEGFVLLDSDSKQAGMEWLKFLSQLQYLMPLFSITPYQIQPINDGILKTDEWKQFVDNLPDAYTEADRKISRHRNYTIFPNETNPPNPYAASLFETYQPIKLAYDVLENGKDPETALGEHADVLRDTLAQAKGN